MNAPTKVPAQLETVRSTGEVNMFNYNAVQSLAHELDCHALVVWMEDIGMERYGEFIRTGKL